MFERLLWSRERVIVGGQMKWQQKFCSVSCVWWRWWWWEWEVKCKAIYWLVEPVITVWFMLCSFSVLGSIFIALCMYNYVDVKVEISNMGNGKLSLTHSLTHSPSSNRSEIGCRVCVFFFFTVVVVVVYCGAWKKKNFSVTCMLFNKKKKSKRTRKAKPRAPLAVECWNRLPDVNCLK